ncbi:MAG: gsiD [Actinomycetia bacterium]|nr:gsiD [Actinomycetes bacterium]
MLGVLVAFALAFIVPLLAPDGLRAAMLGARADHPAAVAQLRADEHLNEPAPVRFVRFTVGVLHANFGRSYVQAVDVEREVLQHLWLTAVLVAVAVFLTRAAFGSAIVFVVLAIEAVVHWPGLGRVLAAAIDVRDVVMIRAVLCVAFIGCVVLPQRSRPVVGLLPPNGSMSATTERARATVAWVWLFVLSLAVAFVLRLPLDNPNALFAARAAPGFSHWLGTDDVGHDVLARVVWGAQATLLLVLAATAVGFVIGALFGALVAETRGAGQGLAFVGRLGIPAVGVCVGLAAILPREPMVFWEWLVPVTIGSGLAWGTRAFDGSVPDRHVLTDAVSAILLAAAAGFTAEAVLGALGLTPEGSLTWGVVLNNVRMADRRPWLELAALVGMLVATVAALRVAAASLRRERPATASVTAPLVPSGSMV